MSYDRELTTTEFEEYRKKSLDTNYYFSHSKFIKLEELPNYNQYHILKEKWFWCDPIKHQEFMFKNYPKK